MSITYATIKGEVINPKKKTLPSGTVITEFAIKIDSQDFKTKEWLTSFMNCKLIGELELESKKLYELTGSFENNKYTKDGVEVEKLILVVFNAKEIDKTTKPQEQEEIIEKKPVKKAAKKEVKKEEEITYADLPF